MTNPELADRLDITHPDLRFYTSSLRQRVFEQYPFSEPLFDGLEAAFPEAARHSERTSLISTVSAVILNLPDDDIDRAAVSGLLHDIGKTGIPPEDRAIFLTPERAELVRTVHMEQAREILRGADCPSDIRFIIMSHHDAFPGNGNYRAGAAYPRYGNDAISGADRRNPQSPATVRLARLIWLADKADRDVNGYEGKKRKDYIRFSSEFYTNYDPESYTAEPKLFETVRHAVRHLFYR